VFVSLTRVKTPEEPIASPEMVGEEMLRWLREIEGFEGLLLLSREGSTIGLTFWESREVAEQHLAARMEFLQRMMSIAEVQIEEILDYDVTFAHLGALRLGE
jgi:hypothetical protein